MKTITVTQALAVPSTSLPSCRFVDEDASWRAFAWSTLRAMAQTGETAEVACGTGLIFSATDIEPSLVVPDER